MNEEIWHPINAADGLYEVSTQGRVRRTGKQVTLKTALNFGGYHSFEARFRGRRKRLSVHRAMAAAFIPNPENKRLVNHLNGIKEDNRIENIEWATHSENLLHAFHVIGRSDKKLTPEAVRDIRTRTRNGVTLARAYGVSKTTIGDVLSGKTWRTAA